MTIEIKVPVLPESVADATIATWHVKAGDSVKRDQNLVDIETDKVVLEVVAPADGVIGEIIDEEGATVLGEQVIAKLEEGGAAPAKSESMDAISGTISRRVHIYIYMYATIYRTDSNGLLDCGLLESAPF